MRSLGQGDVLGCVPDHRGQVGLTELGSPASSPDFLGKPNHGDVTFVAVSRFDLSHGHFRHIAAGQQQRVKQAQDRSTRAVAALTHAVIVAVLVIWSQLVPSDATDAGVMP